VSPEPEKPAGITHRERRVLAGHFAAAQRFGQRRAFTQEYTVAVDALAGHAIQALGDVAPLETGVTRSPATGVSHSGVTEAVLEMRNRDCGRERKLSVP
jgi:hypothetical protein